MTLMCNPLTGVKPNGPAISEAFVLLPLMSEFAMFGRKAACRLMCTKPAILTWSTLVSARRYARMAPGGRPENARSADHRPERACSELFAYSFLSEFHGMAQKLSTVVRLHIYSSCN